MDDRCHYIFVKATEGVPPRVTCNANSGFGVIMMCQDRFIDPNGCRRRGGGGRGHVWGQGSHGISLYFLLSSAMNIKLL